MPTCPSARKVLINANRTIGMHFATIRSLQIDGGRYTFSIDRGLQIEFPASGDIKEDRHGIPYLDCCWIDRRLARGPGYERRRVRHSGRHHSRHPRRPPGGLGLRTFGNLARRGHDWFNHCGIYWRGDFGRDYSPTEESLKWTF